MKTFVMPNPREFNVKTLRLDPDNPRLKLHPGGSGEKEIIERLCRMGSQSPSQLIKNMLTDHGYLHNEIPVVFQESGKSKPVVIDGNRRVAALKMVLNSALIPSTRHGLRGDCEKLVGLVPTKIRCWVTQSKSDGNRIVYRSHNEGSREWESLAKYSTHYGYYKDGMSISEIVQVTGLDGGAILKQINTWILVESMLDQIPDFEIESSGITSFERVTTHYQDFPKKIGIELSAEGVYIVPPSKELVGLVHAIYIKSAKKQGFSREVANNDAAREAFLNGIIPSGFQPAVFEKLNVDAPRDPKGTTGDQEGRPATGPPPAPVVPPPDSRLHVDEPPIDPLPSEKQILLVQKNVGRKAYAIYREYTEVSGLAHDFPIASAALARAMIETTLKFHAKRLKCYSETKDQQNKQQSDLLDSIATKLKQKIASLNLPYSSDMLSSITNSCKAIPELNDVMHKDGSFAARPAVRTAMASLSSAVENLIRIPLSSA